MRCLIAVLLMSCTLTAWSAPPSGKPSPIAAQAQPSTDPWIDLQLADLDRYTVRYQAAFDDELVRYQDTPRELIAQLRKEGWPDSQIYAACLVARTSGRACRLVADAWADDRTQRWDAVAARFGISAGSIALDRMKFAMVQTYKRWSRPLAGPRPD